MGLPATGKTAIYRNPLSEVVEFLNKYHADNYKVYTCARARRTSTTRRSSAATWCAAAADSAPLAGAAREPLPPPHRPRVGVLRARRRPFRLRTTGCRR